MWRMRRRRGGLLVGIGGAALVEAIRFAHGANLKAQYTQNASNAAQGLLEDYRAYKEYLSPGTSYVSPVQGMPSGTSASITVTQDPVRTSLWTLVVDISWTAGGRRGSLSGSVHQEALVYVPP
jgi:hypothetical protein